MPVSVRARRILLIVLSAILLPAERTGAAEGLSFRVHPAQITLDSPESTEQLLVWGRAADGRDEDWTRRATYRVASDHVVVSPQGRVTPNQEGQTELEVVLGERVLRVPVTVRGLATPQPVSFAGDVIPILSKAGCNAGGCHGKAEGQNGFKLSVFGFDPVADHQALVYEGRGRRVFLAAPEQSLLLLKATGTSPHGGGQKMAVDSLWYRRLHRWLAEGGRLEAGEREPVVNIRVEPAEVTLADFGEQQLRVVARHGDGTERNVTIEAEYQSNSDAVAAADREGLVIATDVPGEAAILVRYLGHVAVCRVTHPHAAGEFERPAESNFVDRMVWDKLARLNIRPSPTADDATFLRRVYLDVIGTLPTADEARAFLADAGPDKRTRLIDALLDRPEYAIYWAQKWADLLQVDKDTITPQGAVAFTRWIHEQLAGNEPYDVWVRAIITARGSTLASSPAAFYQVQADPEQAARAVSQLFLGVRIECAQCHHHPFERWDQSDYYALAGFFTGLDRRPAPQGGLKIVPKATAGVDLNLKHPRTALPVPAAALGSPPVEFGDELDRRRALAAWMTQTDNPYLARTLVNRLWSHYFGRGLVEPVDDLRATNPATNEPLLDALAAHLIERQFDIKALTRTLLNSRAYQLSSAALPENALDEQNHSHAAWKPLPAEVLLDAISLVTGVPEEFNGWPRGYRAIQVWDNKLPSTFLETFGRPTRQSVCACERGTEPSVAQALHLMNSPLTAQKLSDRTGRAAQLAGSASSAAEIIDELFLAALSRYPTDGEREVMLAAFDGAADRRESVEDVLWTLLNTKEFVFNH